MEKVIRTSLANKILLCVLALVFTAVGGALLFLATFELGDNEKNLVYFFIPGGIFFFGLAIYFIQYIRVWHVVISTQSIKEVGVFKTIELSIDDVKGYTADDKYLRIVSASTGKNVFAFSLQMGKDKELINWVNATFKNLDDEELEASLQRALLDETLGTNEDERAAKLVNATKVAKVLNIAGIAVAAWGFLFPEPYAWVCIACIALPVISLAPYYYFKGAIKFIDSRNSVYPNVLSAIVFPSAVIGVRALTDFDILVYNNVWTYVLPLAITMMVAIFGNNKALLYAKATVALNLIVGTLAALAFSYGSIIYINCYYDNSTSILRIVPVTDKRVSTGKHTSYYITLDAWGNYPEDEHSIDKKLYNSVDIGTEVKVYELNGSLNIPWMLITN